MNPYRIIKHAINLPTLTRDERGKLEDMQVYGSDAYGESGYSSNKEWIVIGDFNPTSFDHKDTGFCRAVELLGRVAELEWCDEWLTCEDCGRLYRCQPDCYSWLPTYLWFDDCSPVCIDCAMQDPETLIDLYKNDYRKGWQFETTPLQEAGFQPAPERYENGFHLGQNDQPEAIAKRLPAGVDYVFVITGKGQFDIQFELWTREAAE